MGYRFMQLSAEGGAETRAEKPRKTSSGSDAKADQHENQVTKTLVHLYLIECGLDVTNGMWRVENHYLGSCALRDGDVGTSVTHMREGSCNRARRFA